MVKLTNALGDQHRRYITIAHHLNGGIKAFVLSDQDTASRRVERTYLKLKENIIPYRAYSLLLSMIYFS